MLHGSCFYSILNSLYKLKLIRMKMIVCSRDASFVCGCPLRIQHLCVFYGYNLVKQCKIYLNAKETQPFSIHFFFHMHQMRLIS